MSLIGVGLGLGLGVLIALQASVVTVNIAKGRIAFAGLCGILLIVFVILNAIVASRFQ